MGAFFVCLSHGSNDLGNAISPIMHLVRNDEPKLSVKWVFFGGSVAITIGLVLLGQRTMNTIGKKLIKLDFLKGFSVCYATGLSVTIGSLQGIPLSSTHCVVGACAGVYFAGKLKIVKRVYTLPKDVNDEDEIEFTSENIGNDIDDVFNSY